MKAVEFDARSKKDKLQRGKFFLVKSIFLGTFLACLPAFQVKAGININWKELQQGTRPVVFLVNGFGGCDPCITSDLRENLQKEGIAVYNLDWNDIHRRTQQSNFNLSDAQFLEQMNSLFLGIPASRPIVLIGHSFGGDSVLKVAQRTSRRIALLGILDAVELGGLRTRRSVRSNVDDFYNRWTPNPTALIPLNAGDSGELSCQALNCDQKEQSRGYYADGTPVEDECGSLEITCPGYDFRPGASNGKQHRKITHGKDNAIYKDKYIQDQLFKRILAIPVQLKTTVTVIPFPSTQIPIGVMKAVIMQSYQDAFGSFPNESEMSYWLQRSQSESLDLGKLLNYHRDFLKGGGYLDQTIIRSYQTVLNRTPSLTEIQYWQQRVRGERLIFTDLKRAHEIWQRQGGK